MIIEGDISVKATLKYNRRIVEVIYADEKRHDKDLQYVLKVAEEKKIPVKRISRERIEEIAVGKTHGGLIAEVKERVFQTLEDCLIGECPFVVVVEGVEDPFNLGYIIRTLYASGCTGLILRQREWAQVEPIILKSSAGAYEALTIYQSDDIPRDIRRLKEDGLYCYAAMRKDAISYLEAEYTRPIVLLIGGEIRGLSSKVLKESDQNIYIPYANDFHNALNAAGASAVLGFEILRQRTK